MLFFARIFFFFRLNSGNFRQLLSELAWIQATFSWSCLNSRESCLNSGEKSVGSCKAGKRDTGIPCLGLFTLWVERFFESFLFSGVFFLSLYSISTAKVYLHFYTIQLDSPFYIAIYSEVDYGMLVYVHEYGNQKLLASLWNEIPFSWWKHRLFWNLHIL